MKRFTTAAACAAVLVGLAGCTAADTDRASAVEPAPSADPAAELTASAQEFADALGAGDYATALTYLGASCSSTDRETLVAAANRISGNIKADGSGPLKADRVEARGDRGIVFGFSSGPSDSEAYAPIGAGEWAKSGTDWYATCDRAGVHEAFMGGIGATS